MVGNTKRHEHITPTLQPVCALAHVTIALAVVGSRLDYANCTLVGIPSHNVHRLQRVQNSLARLVVSGSSSSSTELLASLHCLPVSQGISFKLASLVCQSLHLAHLLDTYTPIRQFRSSSQFLMIQPRLNTAFGSRAFGSVDPRIWNDLLIMKKLGYC